MVLPTPAAVGGPPCRIRARRSWGLALFVMATMAAVTEPGTPAAAEPFNFLEVAERRSDDITAFTKWTAVLERHADQAALAPRLPCAPDRPWVCAHHRLTAFLDGLHHVDPWQQLVAVNGYINGIPYVPDRVKHGLPDFWQTPAEFLAGGGDCEDFAIAKYFSLKRLGWTDDALRLVVAHDLKTETGHATLAVRLAGRTWLLDNQLKEIAEWRRVQRYRPLFSINRSSWWLHQEFPRT
ncbi:MAG: hypothetical protein EA406_08285 [Rhodospirillales bacterium]|nr:MAG: hypothetical protein EA406_08285 [Rhodospirillales bacterium]